MRNAKCCVKVLVVFDFQTNTEIECKNSNSKCFIRVLWPPNRNGMIDKRSWFDPKCSSESACIWTSCAVSWKKNLNRIDVLTFTPVKDYFSFCSHAINSPVLPLSVDTFFFFCKGCVFFLIIIMYCYGVWYDPNIRFFYSFFSIK